MGTIKPGSLRQMVFEAFVEHDLDTPTDTIVNHVKRNHGVDLSKNKQAIHSYRAELRRDQKKKGPLTRRGKEMPKPKAKSIFEPGGGELALEENPKFLKAAVEENGQPISAGFGKVPGSSELIETVGMVDPKNMIVSDTNKLKSTPALLMIHLKNAIDDWGYENVKDALMMIGVLIGKEK